MSFFCANAISAGYGTKNVIDGISFQLEKGTIVGILGANGCGKTTLLKSVCGILPHEGTCTLDGTVLETLSARQFAQLCSYIPQRSGISIDISALDVVLMGFNPWLKILEHPTLAMKEAAKEALSKVGLSGKAHANYLHLSEGQKQLCVMARTLVSDCKLLLLDEPESALDFHYRYQILDTLRQWIADKQSSALITLHDPVLALNYCDQLLLLSDGKLIGQILPGKDSLQDMEYLLNKLYGAVSLHLCKTRNGSDKIMMLKEDSE